MNTYPILLALLACGSPLGHGTGTAQAPPSAPDPTMSFYDLSCVDIHGQPYSFGQLKGHQVMVVNTASECGFTPQYKQLEELYAHYKDKGFILLGFPSNDFGQQEPGDEATIQQFCQKNYGVTFPLMSKVVTKGEGQHPVYQWLTHKALNGRMDSEVKWNFQKYLIDKDGTLHTVLASATEPMSEEVLNWLDGKP